MGTYFNFNQTIPYSFEQPSVQHNAPSISKNRLSNFIQGIIAGLAVLILSPIFLLTYIAIRLESRGNPIYTQNRVGINGRIFKIYKFRSMYQPEDKRYIDVSKMKSDRQGVCKKFLNDPRITNVGKFIRRTSIDELPQLWNVLKGDMNLIGPRPALPNEVGDYQYSTLDRLNVKPGLTGLWQVSGRADTTFEQQIKLDIEYINCQSFLFDLRILFLTIPAVISGRGAY